MTVATKFNGMELFYLGVQATEVATPEILEQGCSDTNVRGAVLPRARVSPPCAVCGASECLNYASFDYRERWMDSQGHTLLLIRRNV